MLDNEKVRLMTQIAIYEKGKGKDDIKRVQFYEKDFISYNNFKMQVSVTFALLFIMGVEFANIVLDNLAVINAYNFIWLAVKYVIIWVILMITYTTLSTIANKKTYSKSRKRIETYEALLNDLEAILEDTSGGIQ
jgi:hypothetical protein